MLPARDSVAVSCLAHIARRTVKRCSPDTPGAALPVGQTVAGVSKDGAGDPVSTYPEVTPIIVYAVQVPSIVDVDRFAPQW